MTEYKDRQNSIPEESYLEDLQFMQSQFENDGLEIPDSLSVDSVRQMLDAGPARTSSSRRWLRPLISVAACAAFVIALIPVMQAILPDHNEPAGLDTAAEYSEESESDQALSADAAGVYHFKSYKELDLQIQAMLPEESDQALTGDVDMVQEDLSDEVAMSNADEGSGVAAGNESLGSGSLASSAGKGADSNAQHSSTYTQVEGIDEADIVKTDGRYIYYVSGNENQIIIAAAKNGKTRRVAKINCSKADTFAQDMYVLDDHLVIIGSDEAEQNGTAIGRDWTESTAVNIYDISDRSKPRHLDRYSQSGYLVSSRLVDGRLCLVTNDVIYTYKKGTCLPFVTYGEDTAAKLPIGSIGCIPQATAASFAVVSLMDLSAGKLSKDTVRTEAVLGGSDEIYCSGDHLYLTGAVNADAPGTGPYATGLVLNWKTQILKVSIADGKVKFQSSAIVKGTVNNQFSMDESNGTFKIATTASNDGTDVNNLFIFDEKMKKIGQVIGFAKDEHIEAVRYIKDKAYVITYEQTDPLFIIDLSDPADPIIEGHVKIRGFSTLLVPADADHLLGLGFSTETTDFGEATDGVKLALFDTSDPSQPEVAASKSFPGMYSPVQYDHKALLVGPDASYYAIPYELEPADWNTDTDIADDFTFGILVFSAKAGKIKVLQNLKTSESVSRCIYIGDCIYGICDDDSIEGFPVKR